MGAIGETAGIALTAWWTKRRGRDAISAIQRTRLARMITFARTSFPFYAEHYRDQPTTISDPMLLPTTDKKMLMARFNDWCTDRVVTLAKAEAIVSDPARVGEPIAGKDTAVTTSGTTGRPGIFLLDPRTTAVAAAMSARMLGSWLAANDVARLVRGRGRMAMVMASEGHFASSVAAAQLKKRRGDRVEVLSARMPMREIVARLNRFQPVLLAPYASMAALLADEQEAGRLKIAPALLALSAEGLAADEYGRIATAFGAKVGNSYAASECPFLSYSCEHGWLHVNEDWVLAEPVDAEHQLVAPGEPSHTVLISNLANRIQPILRYDLGDSVVQRPDPCPCGNPLIAIQVQGRSADVLKFTSPDGATASLAPISIGSTLDGIAGVSLFQVAQTSPTTLRLRLQFGPGADRDRTSREACLALSRLLSENGLERAVVELGDEPPEQSPGGKFREVIPYQRPTGQGDVG